MEAEQDAGGCPESQCSISHPRSSPWPHPSVVYANPMKNLEEGGRNQKC